MLNATHKEGYAQGIKYMEEKMLSACDTDKPIEISSKALLTWIVRSGQDF